LPATPFSIERDRKLSLELRGMLAELPSFCHEFFTAIEPRTSVRTRIGYAVDLKTFFTYLRDQESEFYAAASVVSLSLDDMRSIATTHIDRYLGYVTIYKKQSENADSSVILENAAAAKERKLSAIRSLFKYLFKRELLESNVAALIDSPKKNQKPIIRLEPDEIARMIDGVESGEALSPHQQRYHERTRTRDVALITLLLGTGIRVSECVGLNIDDLDLRGASMAVTRKGGDRVILYLSDEVMRALAPWLKERSAIEALAGHENALFLSLQKRRMTVLSVENLVKKYASSAAPLKHITPHKLRSTYGTQLYQATGDIYLVADVLGHSDVNTTRKHYAAMADDRRRQAAKAVKLRDDS